MNSGELHLQTRYFTQKNPYNINWMAYLAANNFLLFLVMVTVAAIGAALPLRTERNLNELADINNTQKDLQLSLLSLFQNVVKFPSKVSLSVLHIQ